MCKWISWILVRAVCVRCTDLSVHSLGPILYIPPRALNQTFLVFHEEGKLKFAIRIVICIHHVTLKSTLLGMDYVLPHVLAYFCPSTMCLLPLALMIKQAGGRISMKVPGKHVRNMCIVHGMGCFNDHWPYAWQICIISSFSFSQSLNSLSTPPPTHTSL